MAVLDEPATAAAEQDGQCGVERGPQWPAIDAISEGDLVGCGVGRGRQARDLVTQRRLEQVVGMEPQDPVAGDTGLLDGEAPLPGMGVERPLDRADIGKAAGDRQRVVGRVAVDDHDLFRPCQALERAADVGGFVVGQDDGGDIGQHDAWRANEGLCGWYKRVFWGRPPISPKTARSRPPKSPYSCRVTGRLDEKARGAQTSTPTRLASPQAGSGSASQVFEKSDKSPLCSRERLVNVQE